MSNLKLKNLLPLLLLISLWNTMGAQNLEYGLSFQIQESTTNYNLENANIAISPCNCGGVSNGSGEFSINLPGGNYHIEVTYVGFDTYSQDITLDMDMQLQVRLNESQEKLSEVVVRARKNNAYLETPQMGVLQLKSQELKKIPAAVGEFDVLRGMTLLPGVNNSGEISNGLSVRGGSLDQNLLLYDYAPVFNPTHLFGLFSVFTPDVLSSVDLYRANIPARYGGRATSVVDVKVKNPYTNQFKINGGIGLVSSRLALETPLIEDKLMLIAGGRAGFTDFLLPLFSERLKNTRARFYDGTLKLLYLPTEKDQITFTGFYSKDFYQLDLITKIENINAENNQYDFQTLNGTVHWLHTFNEDSNLRTILVGSNYTPRNIFPELDNSNEIEYESSIKYLSLISEYSKKASDAFDYYFGVQANRYQIHPGELDPGSSEDVLPVTLPTETSYEFSSFTNFNWKPIQQLTLSAGLRFNHYMFLGPYTLNTYDDSGNLEDSAFFEKGSLVESFSNLEPRLGVSLQLGENTSLKASYANVNQYLQNIYNSTTPIPTSRWKAADPNISPQYSNSYGFGAYKTLDDGKIEVGLEGYYRQTENNLTYKPGARFFLEEAIETDVVQVAGKAYGLELSLRKPKGKVNGWLNYTWSRSLLRSDDENPANAISNNKWFNSDFDRPHVINATVNLESNKYNTLSFNFTGQTGRPYTVANGVFELEDITIPIFLERNNARLPVYHRLDFSWKVKYTKKKNPRWVGDWTFTVYNVYGRKNPFNIFYGPRANGALNEVFGGNPIGAYELTVANSPIFALTYNFSFQ